MASLKDLVVTVALLCAGSVAFAQTAQDNAVQTTQGTPDPSDPPHVTTDSREYCRHLASEIEARRDPPSDVAQLVAEGKRMCSQGHLAGGLVRLRRAFLLIHPDAAAN